MKGHHIPLIAVIVVGGALTGCSTHHNESAIQNHKPTNDSGKAHTNPDLQSASSVIKGVSKSKISGVASFTFDKKRHTLTVATEVSGLNPTEKYSVDIRDADGKVSYHLKEISPDKDGSGSSLTIFQHVQNLNLKGCVIDVMHSTHEATVVGTGSVKA